MSALCVCPIEDIRLDAAAYEFRPVQQAIAYGDDPAAAAAAELEKVGRSGGAAGGLAYESAPAVGLEK